MNLGEMLRRNATCYPDKTALVFEDLRLSYRQFNDRVNRVAQALLGLGVKKGDKVASMLSNCPEALEVYFAAAKIGAIVVPINPMVKGKDLAMQLDNSDSVAFTVGEEYIIEVDAIREELGKIPPQRYLVVGEVPKSNYSSYRDLRNESSAAEPDIEVEENDAYNIMYTSGTTGLPKGIVMTHRIRLLYALFFGVEYGVGYDSRILSSGAIYFNGSFIFLMASFFAGGTFVLLRKFDATEVLKTIQKEKITHSFMVPTQFIALLAHHNFKEYDTSSLQALLSGAAPLSKKTKEDILANFQCQLHELYGLTEGIVTVLRPHEQFAKLGSVGLPHFFSQIKIVDDDLQELPTGEIGEIAGKGPLLMLGYYKNPEATAQAMKNGWLLTGDVGRVDKDGYLYLLDRKKDMIISGGVNIYPRDIEEILARHPKVLECTVFGVPDDKWGESPKAAIVLRDGDEATEEEILSWCNPQLAKYQRIRTVDFLKEFPRNPAGKILKRTLREPYWKDKERQI